MSPSSARAGARATEGFVTLEGERIWLSRSGGGGRAALFCHGNSTSSEVFSSVMQSPLASEFDLIAVDLPGHGRSARSASAELTYSIPGLARVLCALIGELELRDYALVGHSLGGHALCEAMPSLERARGLMLLSAPPFHPQAFPSIYKEDPTAGALFSAELTPTQLQSFASALLWPEPVAPSMLDALSRTIAATDPRFREQLGASIRAGELADEAAIVAGLSVPTALVYGGDDAFIHPSYYRSLRVGKPFRDGTFMIPGAGHSPNLTGHPRFMELMGAFLRSC